eukprot:TRINITY_DN2154_c0_g1_i1.p1 TRINITY_DN2154_c0_g1~~TRINITY_DN2154_c0_g1_i1.p1  ORF type:complete len:483 (-),score=173.34 TRINITY_DN2154_c0_g1_i1:55-1503(-)
MQQVNNSNNNNDINNNNVDQSSQFAIPKQVRKGKKEGDDDIDEEGRKRRTEEVEKKEERRTERDLSSFSYEEPKEWGGRFAVEEKEEMKKEGREAYFTLIEMKNGIICNEYLLSKRSFYSLGRGENCLLLMDHPSVSRIHAIFQLRKRDGALFLFDLGSTHGTKVNKQSIPKKNFVQLKKGDHIRFGESSRTFVVEGGPFLSLDQEQAKQSISQEEQNIRSRKNQQKMMELVKKSKELRKQDEEKKIEKLEAEMTNKEEKGEDKKEETEDAEEANADWTETTKMHRVTELNEDNDDDDDYYDRTRKTKKNTETRTYADLTKEKNNIQTQISKLNLLLDNIKETNEDQNEVDSLDSFMVELKSAERMGDRDKINKQIEDLQTQLEKTNYLLQFVAPAINSIPLSTKAPSSPKTNFQTQNKPKISQVADSKKEEDSQNGVRPAKKQKNEKRNKKKDLKPVVVPVSYPSFIEEDDFQEVPLAFYG